MHVSKAFNNYWQISPNNSGTPFTLSRSRYTIPHSLKLAHVIFFVVCHHNAMISQLPPDTHSLVCVTCINLDNPPSKHLFTCMCIHKQYIILLWEGIFKTSCKFYRVMYFILLSLFVQPILVLRFLLTLCYVTTV